MAEWFERSGRLTRANLLNTTGCVECATGILTLSSKATAAWLSFRETAQYPWGRAHLSTISLDDALRLGFILQIFLRIMALAGIHPKQEVSQNPRIGFGIGSTLLELLCR